MTPTDPRIPEVIKHLQILAKRHQRKLVVQDYLEYRAKNVPSLPALTTVYRLFGSWGGALKAAGIKETSKSGELSRTSDDKLILALQQAANDLGVKVLSSHAYDEYRKSQAPELPSSSVIRKWLGYWAEATKAAGLETAERTVARKPTMIESIEALRQAKADTVGLMSPKDYSNYRDALSESERNVFPDLSQVLAHFPSWEAALRAADVEQADTVHPTGLWTAEEARRIARSSEKVLGRPLDKKGYEEILSQSKKPMPSWKILSSLLQL